MYKKLLWLSALTACFVTVFFAILGFTKVNQQLVEFTANTSCSNLHTLSISDNLKPTEPLHHESPQPRIAYTTCPKKDKEIQPRQDDANCPHCPKHNEQNKISKKSTTNCKQCLKEMADDSTEDNLIISQQLVEQQKHLPHFRKSQMHIWEYLSPLFATMPFNPNDNLDLKYNNAFTIEIIENRDENGWRFYINGQEFQPNINNPTNDGQNNTPENIPMPLPEFPENNPISPDQENNSISPDQSQPNTTEDQQHEDSTLLPEQTPYM